MTTILIAEDDKSTRVLTAARLKPHYAVVTACNGKEALDICYKQDVPVIMLTARQEFEDKKLGFSTGTDDYLTKPVNYEELLWRIEALLRRARIHSEKQIVTGETTLSAENYCVTRPGQSVELPKKEFELLFKLLSYPGVIFTKDQFLEEIWGFDTDSDETTVKTHISRLRGKFDGWKEFQIVTVRGLGYKGLILKEPDASGID